MEERTQAFYGGETRSFVWLANTLARAIPTIPRVLPTDVRGRRLRDRMTTMQACRWRGAGEHYLSPSTDKIDTGTHVLEQQLAEAGRAARSSYETESRADSGSRGSQNNPKIASTSRGVRTSIAHGGAITSLHLSNGCQV